VSLQADWPACSAKGGGGAQLPHTQSQALAHATKLSQCTHVSLIVGTNLSADYLQKHHVAHAPPDECRMALLRACIDTAMASTHGSCLKWLPDPHTQAKVCYIKGTASPHCSLLQYTQTNTHISQQLVPKQQKSHVLDAGLSRG
jgi:hypothetical protein